MKKNSFCRRRNAAFVLCAALFCAHVTGCSAASLLRAADDAEGFEGGFVFIEDEPVPLAGTLVLTPVASGADVHSGGGATLDSSNVSEGYIMAKYEGSNGKVKIQITRAGGTTYTYDLNSRGSYETFPLTDGNGTYQIGIFTNTSGQVYAQALAKTVQVELRDPFLPFLYPSQYVNFNQNSVVVAAGQQLAAGASDDLTIIQNVYNYVTQNVTYDNNKAMTIAAGGLTGYLPVVDTVLTTGTGICFDYAAVMAAMLRSQQIPTRLEVGYVSTGQYHAWISTYVKDVGWVNGIIQFDGQSWKMMDPTFAASAGDASTQQFIGTGTNYRTQYVY